MSIAEKLQTVANNLATESEAVEQQTELLQQIRTALVGKTVPGNPGDSGSYDEGYADGYVEGKADTEVRAIALVNEGLALSDLAVAEVNSLEEIPEKVDEVYLYGTEEGYESGKQAEYDRFWDALQNFGNREIYYSCFCGAGWTNETFKPKYNIVPTNASYLFDGCGEIDLIGALERCGVALDFSKCTQFTYMLRNEAQIKHFPPIDLNSASQFTDGFRYAPNLESASFVNVKPTHSWSNSFTGCRALTDITFSGTIGQHIAFSNCYKLSDASIQSIIDALADLTGQATAKLTLHGITGNALTQAQKDAISAKNWTLVY